MGPSDGGQSGVLSNGGIPDAVHVFGAPRSARSIDVGNWDSACEMLRTYYTVAQARQDSEVCAMRIHYLEISEPAPQLADFVPAPAYTDMPDAPRQLDWLATTSLGPRPAPTT